ncbi:MAG: TonB-dependent receptor, partial [Flavisolibacter sp.]
NYSNKEMRVEKTKMNIQLHLDIKPMEALLVGGNMNAIKRKSDATSVTVLDAKTLEKIPVNTLDQIFRGWVPGTNNFDPGRPSDGFPTLTIRGAGSPGSLSIIAVYIDGIEYAGGSGYLSQLDKSNIDRIEVVRGPGAATLYGTGSNGGIVQIFTKRGKANQTTVNLTTSAGFYKSKWMKTDAFQQMHNVETISGFKNFSVKLGGSYRTVNAYLPDGGEKNKGFYASVGYRNGKWQTNFTTRYNAKDFHLARNPIYDTAIHPRTDITIETAPGVRIPAYRILNVIPSTPINKDGITETTISGVNLSHKTFEKWVNNLDAGYTTNKASIIPLQDGITPLQRLYSFEKYTIATLRYSNVLSIYPSGSNFSASITSGAEYKKYTSSSFITRATTASTFLGSEGDNENYGAFIQANPSYKNVYLTLGLRYEKNNLFYDAWNPRLGITTNFEIRSLMIKPRISWGKGITAPSHVARFGSPRSGNSIVLPNPYLKPQSQQGFDYGVEVYDKNGKYKFEAVYYDNVLKDLITQGGIYISFPVDSNLTGVMYTNIAKVANNGWEFTGEFNAGRFNVRGTLSIMNTIIKDSSGTYQLTNFLGGNSPGSRLKLLPKHTAGVNLTYQFSKLFGKSDNGSVSLNLSEVDGIMSLDYRTYALNVAYGRTAYIAGKIGDTVETSPVFRVGLYAEYNINSNLRFFVQGSNILDSYKYEFTIEYPTHGAAWLFGFKYSFSQKK